MNCVKCGKPVIHGVGGYAGPQCMCWASPAPTGPLLDVTETLMQQSMEITRLRAELAASREREARLQWQPIETAPKVGSNDWLGVLVDEATKGDAP